MIDKQHFDFDNREPQVQIEMAALVFTYVHGGYPGGLPVAVHDFKQKLQALGYGGQYSEDAAAYCEHLGNESQR